MQGLIGIFAAVGVGLVGAASVSLLRAEGRSGLSAFLIAYAPFIIGFALCTAAIGSAHQLAIWYIVGSAMVFCIGLTVAILAQRVLLRSRREG